MHGQLNHLRANEHMADLRRAAERKQYARSAKHQSFLIRVMAQLRRDRPIGGRAPARLSDAEPATGATEVAAAEA